jgi:magnesium-transporting ATPase (P-type)
MTCQEVPDCTPYDFSLKGRLWTDILNAAITCISIIVCAIPEGLPLAVTIAQASASSIMYK